MKEVLVNEKQKNKKTKKNAHPLGRPRIQLG